MEDNNLDLHILKAVKKTTYNAVINKALNINPTNSPIKGLTRSQSFKKIINFVPKLKPRKSTFIPTPLKLNDNNNLNKDKEDEEKRLSGDEIFIDSVSSSSSSLSSSDMNNSSEEEKDKIKKKENEIKKELNFNNKTFSINLEKIESNDDNDIDNDCDTFYLNEIKENMDNGNKIKKGNHMENMRKKMSQIKAKIEYNKFKETEGVIHDNFKENYDIGLKKYETEEDYHSNLHASLHITENKNKNIKYQSKSIFEVLSNSKNSIKQ